jgi:hypothetical protein
MGEPPLPPPIEINISPSPDSVLVILGVGGCVGAAGVAVNEDEGVLVPPTPLEVTEQV